MLSTLYLAAEDTAGLAVGRKLVAEAPPLVIYREDNAHGYGRLRLRAKNFDQMGRRMPVLMLTDLDRRACPSEMISDWLGATPSSGFLFRVCVREVEAWILADQEQFAAFLGISTSRMPQAPEALADPKAELIKLSQLAKTREMRVGFKPRKSANIGPRYNELLEDFISSYWRPDIAASSAPSLARARLRIRALAARVAL